MLLPTWDVLCVTWSERSCILRGFMLQFQEAHSILLAFLLGFSAVYFSHSILLVNIHDQQTV
jgi:hypothetical protein